MKPFLSAVLLSMVCVTNAQQSAKTDDAVEHHLNKNIMEIDYNYNTIKVRSPPNVW